MGVDKEFVIQAIKFRVKANTVHKCGGDKAQSGGWGSVAQKGPFLFFRSTGFFQYGDLIFFKYTDVCALLSSCCVQKMAKKYQE